MALKGDRVEHLTDISFFKSDAVAERGLIVAHAMIQQRVFCLMTLLILI
jgi:hypothetical protein